MTKEIISEIENRVTKCILDDINFGYDAQMVKGKIKSGSYVGSSPETFKSENERLKGEREWILCDDDMPEVDETVWITNGCGWTALGCLVECEGGYCWAVTNGIIYEEDGKIISECELDDDYDVVYWHKLPKPPKQ